jgi:vitamin B12 transporter
VKLGYDLNKSDRLEWVYLDSRQSFLTPPGNYSGGTTDISNHNQIMANGVQWQHGWDDKNISRFRHNSALVASDSNAPNADPNTGNSDLPWKYKTTSKTYSLDHELLSEAGLFNFLIERKEDQFKADGNEYVGGWEANAPVDSSRSQNAIGLGYNLHSNRHIVNAAFRNDRYSNFEPHNSYSASYGYEATHDWVLSASLANGFKAPSLEEMYGKYGSVSLLPETNISRELALKYNRYPNKFRVSLFDNSVNDLISARPMSYVACPACYYNVGKASIKGISLSGQTKIMDVNVQTNLDLLDPMDQIKHKQLSLRSKQNFRIAADKPFATSQMGIEYQYLGKRFDDSDNTVVLPAYGLVNLWVKTPISSDWKWFNRVDNLTSQKYQQLNCTPDICKFASPGVTFFTAIQWQPK